VAGVNAPLMIAFQAACATTQGQMLPVSSPHPGHDVAECHDLDH
jgi:hypothetical protein